MKHSGLTNKLRLWPFLLALVLILSCTAFANALTFPSGLTRIEAEAFMNDASLTGTLDLPRSVTYIGDRAFDGCTGLTGELVLPDGVTYIGSRAFADCTGLTGTVVIPNSVTYLAEDAFAGTSLTIVHEDDVTTDTDIPTTDTDIPTTDTDIPTTDTDLPPTTDTDLPGDEVITMTDLPEGLLFEMTAEGAVITAYTGPQEGDLVLPATINGVPVVAIGDQAFQDCYGLSGSVIIPSTVTRIGASAFYGCGGLDGYVIIPASVKEIGDFAFFDCYSLTGSLTIPGTVESIGESAFAFCESMTGSLSLPADVALGSRCFQGAGFTGSITVPATMNLGANVFAGTDLVITWEAPAFTWEQADGAAVITGWNGPVTAGLTIPETLGGLTVTTIGESAFASIGLEGEIVIPGCVTTISADAFRSNPGVTSLTLNEGLVTIGEYAFGGCTGLTGVITLPSTAVDVADTAFAGTGATVQ